MSELTYIRLLNENDADIPQLLKIHQLPEIKLYINTTSTYFYYVTNTENVYYFKVYDNDKLVASIHIEKMNSVLSMSVLVFPEYQRMGYGSKIIKDIQDDVFAFDYDTIEVSIDERNTASLKLFKNARFIYVSKEDELLYFTYKR